MINYHHLTEFVIKPAISDLNLYSQAAVNLLVFTCANESDFGTYLKQNKGPAIGIFQMEPRTYADVWTNYLMKSAGRSYALSLVHNFDCPTMPSENRMIYDLRYATAMARLYYRRISDPLPDADDLEGIWRYYKHYYNTPKGKAERESAMHAYHRVISP